ncbi:MFS transporter [Nonomuraea insulae]|uniref:MFS transporter n=1 Tax=Nonomuraea insulae TaxID=1616787 RepID=A0ABW1CY58_9ACTN
MWIVAGLTALCVALWRRFGKPDRAGREEGAAAGRRSGVVVAALLVGALTASLSQTIVIAALPVLEAELGVSTTAVTWVLTAFMLSSAVATPIAGRLGDLFGYRRVLVACLGCFTAGTLVCALAAGAHSLGWLVAGRALQGVVGGVFPLAFGVVRTAVPPARLPGIVALLSAMFGIGGATGMVVAGPVAGGAGTAWLFWGALVLAVAALAGSSVLPAGRERVAGPRLDPRLLAGRALVTTNLATFVISAAMFGVISLVPRFVQTSPSAGYGFGSSVTEAGLIMIPVALAMLAATPLAPRLGRRLGTRTPLQAGAVCAAVSFLALAAAHDRLWHVYAVGLLLGAGYGLAFASIGNLVVEAVEPHLTGVATGVNTIVRTLGGAAGAQIAAAILASGAAPVPAEPDYVTALVTFAVLAVAALAAATAVPAAAARLTR